MKNTKKSHWETVFTTKNPNEVSWFQENPETSLNIIRSLNLPKTARIIDVGGGDSYLVDFLLQEGFENITVLDISEKAIEKVKDRLGKLAEKVEWIVSDIIHFQPLTENYDVWHDRAAFHFLVKQKDINKYLSVAKSGIKYGGYLTPATFSEEGPMKCSGLEVKQYSEASMTETFKKGFEKIRCINENHTTPFGSIQNFTFCTFQRK